MKRLFGIMMAMLLVFAPLTARANYILEELPELTSYEDDDYYIEEDEFDEDIDESEDYDLEDEDEDDLIASAAGGLTIDDEDEESNEEVKECEQNKLFSKTNIIFLAVGLLLGFLLNLVTVLITRCKCKCCESNKEKKSDN